MKKNIFLIFNLLFVLGNVYSQEIVKIIPSPTNQVSDIAFDGSHLWVNGKDDFKIYKISAVDGTILKVIPTNIIYPKGLTFDGSHLWINDSDNLLMQQIDTLNGDIIKTISTPPTQGQSSPAGIAWDGSNLWVNDDINLDDCTATNDMTFYMDTAGIVLQEFNSLSKCPKGLAFDGEYLWSSDNETKKIYKIDTELNSIIDSIDAPGGKFPNGLTYEESGYLWVANNDSDSLYRIELDEIHTSLNESKFEQLEFCVYPNPSTGKFLIKTISKFNSEKMSITIFNTLGQVILTKDYVSEDYNFEIDLSAFNSNVFHYIITTKRNANAYGTLLKMR